MTLSNSGVPCAKLVRCAAACLIASLFVCHAWGQGPTFSVDYQGPTVGGVPGGGFGFPDSFAGVPIDEGSILTTFFPGPPGPNPPTFGPPPGTMVGSLPGSPGSILGGMGIVPGVFGGLELDALSYGRDFMRPLQTPVGFANVPQFSVDEFAIGIPGSPVPPNVTTEGAFGAGEASADVFAYVGPYLGVPPGPVFGNTAVMDGDGLPPFGGPGTGLIEPNPPSPLTFGGDFGDNLDAVDMDTTVADVMPGAPIYFSLDAQFPDPLEIPPGAGPPPNTGTAIGNGGSGADVFATTPGGLPLVFIPGPMLGLDLLGFDTDDLDALALFENGDGAGIPSAPGLGGDEILFSVRRGSAVIGMPDSAFGVPIEEGDILTVPTPGGASPFPSIFIPAEALGLATVRGGFGTAYGVPNFAWGGQDIWADDLDALDVVPEPSGLALLSLSLLAFVGQRRRR